jgi:hypothetical protein
VKRTALAAAACLAAVTSLAGCASDSGAGALATAEADTATPTVTATATATATIQPEAVPGDAAASDADARSCERFVGAAGPAYGWLTTLEQSGAVATDAATPGYLDVYQLGGTATLFANQPESLPLRHALGVVKRQSLALHKAIDNGWTVSPAPLKKALEDAAQVCEDSGFPIDWYAG